MVDDEAARRVRSPRPELGLCNRRATVVLELANGPLPCCAHHGSAIAEDSDVRRTALDPAGPARRCRWPVHMVPPA